ncbi:helix-turn-helix domain-containing protein [Rhodobacter sp. CZR27]|uniref:helix-turn-helix domain-containing protein n=1 Tax=Rhodobacter sp. CZR27 TaxID=2033869 RepID=UPI001E5B36B7|nr:helix-turn-helix domain-containing protein [Rhodobacter sp. CZR27]
MTGAHRNKTEHERNNVPVCSGTTGTHTYGVFRVFRSEATKCADKAIQQGNEQMADQPPLDAINSAPAGIWGLPAIAQALGISIDTARRWARSGKAPIRQPGGGRYYADRGELAEWLGGRQ